VQDKVQGNVQRTPQRRKRPAPDLTSSPAASQRTINSFFSPSPRRSALEPAARDKTIHVIDLISSPVAAPHPPPRAQTPTHPPQRHRIDVCDTIALPDSVTRRRQRGPLKRAKTASNVFERHETDLGLPNLTFERSLSSNDTTHALGTQVIETLDLAIDSSPVAFRRSFADSLDVLPETRRLFVSETSSLNGSNSESMADSRQVNNTTEMPNAPRPRDSHITSRPLQAIRRSPRQVAQKEEKKKRIKLRQSLQGAWTEVEAETMDLSGVRPPAHSRRVGSNVRGWRKSGVEVLDLTAS
jgi:Holliday junction resolvase YEN1